MYLFYLCYGFSYFGPKRIDAYWMLQQLAYRRNQLHKSGSFRTRQTAHISTSGGWLPLSQCFHFDSHVVTVINVVIDCSNMSSFFFMWTATGMFTGANCMLPSYTQLCLNLKTACELTCVPTHEVSFCRVSIDLREHHCYLFLYWTQWLLDAWSTWFNGTLASRNRI